MRTLALLPLLLVLACAKPASEPQPPSPDPIAEEPVAAGGGEAGKQLTASACESEGGQVVGDIGDGAIHRPDYRCESGAAPLGTIVAEPGAAIAVEGAVCCK